MDAFGAIFNLILFALIIYGISRVSNYFNDSKKKLSEIDKKLDEIKEFINQEDKKM